MSLPNSFRSDQSITGRLSQRSWRPERVLVPHNGRSAFAAGTALHAPNRSSGRREERAPKPVLKGSTISGLEICHPIDTAPPVGEKMLLPHD
jgi:hypothetical protein